MSKKKRNIKSSKLNICFANNNKIDRLHSFLDEYNKVVKFYVDYLFYNKIYYNTKEEIIEFCIKEDKLDCPSFISTKDIDFESNLSQRAIKCAAGQACGIINAIVNKRKKYLYVKSLLLKENKCIKEIDKLIEKTIIIYPKLGNINAELNSICCEYIENKNLKHFDGLIILKSLGSSFGKIIIPVKHTKHSRKLEKKGNLLSSFLVSKKGIHLRYEFKKPQLKTEGDIVGVDQGIKTCLSMSDKQVTKPNKHNQDLDFIIKKLSRKKIGSKLFYKTKEHKKNYINWSINQLDFSNIKELRLEKIENFRYKKNVGKYLNNFGEKLIKRKVVDKAMQSGVRFVEQDASYRSVRCSRCGYSNRKNRKGKLFNCIHCSFYIDADYNASCNHEQDLPSAKFLRFLAKKPKEFFWKQEGFFDLQGQEFTVLDEKKDKNI